MTDFFALRRKTYSYFTDNGTNDYSDLMNIKIAH